MKKYIIPAEYYFRLHHVRPRFKSDIENVLLFMATEISSLPNLQRTEFNDRLNTAIKSYPGNAIRTVKTINNWRTEISSLFAFFIEYNDKTTAAGRRAKELAEKQDLVEMFKKFLFSFQYPGAHVKAYEALKMIEKGIHFKPAQYILKVLQAGEESNGLRASLTKEELCHCILNDLRCTRDNESPVSAWNRVVANRATKVIYDGKGDVVRYAGDILDYMEIANLLLTHDGKHFFINTLENETVLRFINSSQWFSGYDDMIAKRNGNVKEVGALKEDWFKYANSELSETDFETDLLAFVAETSEEYAEMKAESLRVFEQKLADDDVTIVTKDIGDMGESIVHSHECQRVKIGGRADLIHLIKRIPTQFAVGYDIQSVEIDEQKRYIEVKTTISSKPLMFNKVHLTTNEWNTASTIKDRYFVYRLLLSKHSKKLFIIQDPVGLYKKDTGVIEMIPRNGVEISFKDAAGHYEELLTWIN
mgnify:CR=1 FL=1